MSFPSKSQSQSKFVKDAIPFESDTVKVEGGADPEIDFSIVHIGECTEYKEATEAREQNQQNVLRLNNIQHYLTTWRANAVTEDILASIRLEFYALKESATATGFNHAAQLSYLVGSLLDETRLTSDNSSLLNLLEEMHDGLVAELGFISETSGEHILSLINMVQLLLTDEPATSSALESAHDGYSAPFQAGYREDPVENPVAQQITPPAQYQPAPTLMPNKCATQIAPPISPVTSQMLLVRVGKYRFALLLHTIEQVVRAHNSETQSIDGRHYAMLAEKSIPVINSATCLGETHTRAEGTFNLLVISRPSGDAFADSVVAFEIDQFQKIIDMPIKTAGRQLASLVGVIGVTILPDDSIVLVLEPQQFLNSEAL